MGANCWLIGKFECDYGYHDIFTPEIFDVVSIEAMDASRRILQPTRMVYELAGQPAQCASR